MDYFQEVHFHHLSATSRQDLVIRLTVSLLKTDLQSMFCAGT